MPSHVSAPPTQSSGGSSGSTSPALLSMDSQFEPLDVIGTGSFGIIRKVRRKADGHLLARKELNYGRMDERDLRQLGEEVNILQNLGNNENIVKYHERYVDKQNFMLYILMEYCAQGDLAGIITRCRRDQSQLPEEVVWSYLAQITSALADCHAPELTVENPNPNGRGNPTVTVQKKAVILHRDIKPENVFLDQHGVVKLGDFGLSKAMEMAAFTNTYVGTPYYMSPELINGEQYDVKSDIWALGCLIYELCAWHPPFHQAQTQPELAKLIRDGRIPNLPRGYSPALQALIKSMLRQDPRLRPDTKAILNVEQVKSQVSILEVHRYARELKKQQAQLAEREASLNEREQRLRTREQRFSAEKETFRQQVALQQQEWAHRAAMKSEEAENLAPLASDLCLNDTGASEFGEIGETIGRPPSSASATFNGATGTTRGAGGSRRPLEERRSFNPASQQMHHAKRLSLAAFPGPGSPMQLDTPYKGSLQHLRDNDSPVVGRQVKTSKSLINLGARGSKSPDETASVASTASGGSSKGGTTRSKGSSSNDESEKKRFVGRRSDSAAAPKSPTKTSFVVPPVPTRRPAADRADTMPPPSAPASRPSAAPRTSTAPASTVPATSSAPPPLPDYDLVEDIHLPSPFLRKNPQPPLSHT